MKQSRFHVLVEYLLDYLFDIATIMVAGYVVIRHQVEPFRSSDIANLATWILAVLGLIAVSGLWDRHRRLRRIEELAQESHKLIERYIGGRIGASDFFQTERGLSDQAFAQAATIYLSGITLTRTTRDYMYVLGQRLVAGAYIRIVIADPTNDATLQEFIIRGMGLGKTTVEYWRTRLQNVATLIDTIANTPGNRGRLEVGYLPFIPSFGFVFIDPDEAHGLCIVEVYHHKTTEPHPTFKILARDDPYWYQFFCRQYNIIWNSCRIETLPRNAS